MDRDGAPALLACRIVLFHRYGQRPGVVSRTARHPAVRLSPAEEYLLIQKWVDVDGDLTLEHSATVETLITFLGSYGFVGGHVMNFNWPLDLVVGSADLTALISGFNYNPDFTEALCSWEVVNVASHGWILVQPEAEGYSEAYVHETIFDEFDEGPQVMCQCLLNSFDLEMVYLQIPWCGCGLPENSRAI